MRDIHNTTRPILKKFTYVDGTGTDCTVFLGLGEDEWDTFKSNGAKDLEPLRRNIVLMVRGRDATPREQEDAIEMFNNIFHSVTPEPRHRPADPA